MKHGWTHCKERIVQALLCIVLVLCMISANTVFAAEVSEENTTAEEETEESEAEPAGWQETEGKLYYLDGEGTPVTGLQCIDGNIYYFLLEDGSLYSGWATLAEKTFYFDENGIMQRGDCVIDGQSYRFLETGEFITGWYEKDGLTFYRDQHGYDQKGFIYVDGVKYYVNDDGLQKGSFENEGIFYADENGRIYTGECLIAGRKAYYSENGEFLHGWKKNIEGFSYYDENGVMYVGPQTVDGVSYYFDEKGILAVNEAVGMYWADSKGALTRMEVTVDNLDAALDEILAETGKDITSIASYVKGRLRYKYMDKLATKEEMAVYALKNKRCSCYYYEALTSLLLERAGYQTQTIQGKGFVYAEHYWNLVYTTRKGVEGWYHVDSLKGQYIRTDAEMVSKGFKWEHKNYPATP